jgi:hypothetical protein
MAKTDRIEVRDLRGGGWFRVDNTVIDKYGAALGAYGIAVYAVLCRFANNDTQETYPSLATIGKRIGCARSTVQKSIKALEVEGLICKEQVRSDRGDWDHNRYWLLDVRGVPSGGIPLEGVYRQAVQGIPSGGNDQDSWIKTKGIWDHVLSELEHQVSRGAFSRWLAGSELVALDDGTATCQVCDSYAVDWCSNRLRKPIERTLAGIADQESIEVTFVSRGDG